MSKKRLIEETNYLSTPEYIKGKDNYPLKGDSVDKEHMMIRELAEKISNFNRPISYLLSHRQDYGLIDYPSYADFVLLLEEKGVDFTSKLERIEHKLLSGEAIGNVLRGIDEDNPVAIKGNQIVHKMLGDDKRLEASRKDDEISGAIDILKLLDQVDPKILEGIKCKLTE